MEQGEIYVADFPEAGLHPVIVLSREEFNREPVKAVGYTIASDCEPGLGREPSAPSFFRLTYNKESIGAKQA